MKSIGFDYEKLKHDENYPDLVWDHVIKRGSNFDRWGFVTHSADPVSLIYYQYMTGIGGDGGRSLALAVDDDSNVVEGRGRQLNQNNIDSQW